MKRLLGALAGVASLAWAGMAGAATTLDFEDVADINFQQISFTYHGLKWQNTYTASKTSIPVSGYAAGATSGDMTVLNGAGNDAGVSAADGTFTFVSANFTAAWLDDLHLELFGLADGVQLFSAKFTLSSTSPTAVSLGWMGIDQLILKTSGGVPNPAYNNAGWQYAMDDFVFADRADPGRGAPEPPAPLPEPATWAMMIIGYGLSGAAIRGRRHAVA